MALTVCTWLWGDKYGHHYVDRLRAGVERHLRQPHRFALLYPHVVHESLLPGCFIRLRLFAPDFQAIIGAEERIVCLDLDSVITGALDPLFDRPEPFVVLQGANAANPCPYNGSIWMLRAGYRPDVWTELSLAAAAKVPHYEFPDDQAWLAHKLPGAAGWTAGENGVYAFKKPGWPKGDALPEDARIVVFPGHRDPAQFTNLDWVHRHWV